MKEIKVDGKKINIPLNKEIEIKANKSIETVVEENGNVSKTKLTKDNLVIQCKKKD